MEIFVTSRKEKWQLKYVRKNTNIAVLQHL